MEKQYLTPKEASPEMLKDTWIHLPKKPHFLADFVELKTHDSDTIKLESILSTEGLASIVGLNDSSILTAGMGYESKTAEPFHVKNIFPLLLTANQVRRAGEDNESYVMEDLSLAYAIDKLERDRAALQWWCVLSMLANKEFVYNNGNMHFTIPYYDQIGDINITDHNDFLQNFMDACAQYDVKTNVLPTHVILNYNTASKIIVKNEVKEYFTKYPNDAPTSINGFSIHGVKFIIYRDRKVFNNLSGSKETENATIPDDLLVFLSKETASDTRPVLINRASTVLNNHNPSTPYIDTFKIKDDPLEVAVRMYDNFIPSLSHKNIVMHYKLT